ncbi:hypothetical protein QBC41DRAFT_61008 [Cercophora samala]|uniref:Uncharacterized protein n=1 Tax=Cercophora samala TaxID=330535 RepID=A0AA40CWH9_9PEZI|nr:hypothetical protein QBC41DRAFT_61008 [Cercophora samala]
MHRLLSKLKRSHRNRSSQSASLHSPDVIVGSTASQNDTTKRIPSPSSRKPRYPSVDPPIEAFPSEIRRLILCNLRLEDLFVFIRASPVYLQQYLLDPGFIQRQCLFQTLYIYTPDAIYVYLTGEGQFLASRNEQRLDSVQAMIDAYLRARSSGRSAFIDLVTRLNNSQLDDMVHFHRRVVSSLIQLYSRWAFSNLVLQIEGESSQNTEAACLLSSTETLRIMRAMYRYQLICNLFGRGPYSASLYSSYSLSGYNDIFQAFLSTFTAFEIEEVRCIFDYAVDCYDKVFARVASDLHPDNPRFKGQQRPPTPDGAFNCLERRNSFDVYRTRELQIGTASRGLGLLHMVLIKTPYDTNDPREHEDLVITIQSQITIGTSFLETCGGAMNTEIHQAYRNRNPTERDQKESRREPMNFVGDECVWHGRDGDTDPPPPLAWTMIWGGRYSNLYGSCIPECFSRLGYVFWDAERLIRSGGRDFLLRQWDEEMGDDYDPREEFAV